MLIIVMLPTHHFMLGGPTHVSLKNNDTWNQLFKPLISILRSPLYPQLWLYTGRSRQNKARR